MKTNNLIVDSFDKLPSPSYVCEEKLLEKNLILLKRIQDEANVSIYRNNIKNILRTIHSYRRWKEHPLNNPFFTFEKLELMIND